MLSARRYLTFTFSSSRPLVLIRFAMFALIKDIVPIASEAFVDYRMEGMFLTRLEIEAMQQQRTVAFCFYFFPFLLCTLLFRCSRHL